METWLPNQNALNNIDLSKFHVIFSKAIKEKSFGRASGGLLLLIDKKCKVIYREVTPWWIICHCKVSNQEFSIALVYFKPSLQISVIIDLFKESLDKVRSKYDGHPFLLAGDMNARLGNLDCNIENIFESTCLLPSRLSLDETKNRRGSLLFDFFVESGLIVLNGRTANDFPGSFTFISSFGKSVIDLACISILHVDLVKDFVVGSNPGTSKHLPVILTLRIPIEDFHQNFHNINKESFN